MTITTENLAPDKVYKSLKVDTNATYKEKIKANALTRYFKDIQNANGDVIKGGIQLNGEIRVRRVGYKGTHRPTAYFVITVKKGRFFSTGEFEKDLGVFRLLGDTNTVEKNWEGNRRGNYALHKSLTKFLERDLIEQAAPIFLFEELDDCNDEYRYIGMGFPFVPSNDLTIDDMFSPIEIDHEGTTYHNAMFRFIVDTKSVIDKYWLYDLRIGQGNKSDYMPDTWRDFTINGIKSEAVKIAANPTLEISRSKEIIETETVKTGSVVRKGQAKIRKRLLQTDKHCKICQLRYHWILIASHIIPWSAKDYENISEIRGDLDNVLLLCTMHDKLFDRNYITFDENGYMLISSEIERADYDILKISPTFRLNMNSEQAKFMDYHRIVFMEREDKEM